MSYVQTKINELKAISKYKQAYLNNSCDLNVFWFSGTGG